MKKIPQTEEELRIATWWNSMDGQTKTTISRLEYAEQKSYRKLNYEQVKLLYKKWN